MAVTAPGASRGRPGTFWRATAAFVAAAALMLLASSPSSADASTLPPPGPLAPWIVGTVTAPDGTPVSGATVSIASIAETWTCCQITTDSDGRYEFGSLQPGQYTVNAWPPNGSRVAGLRQPRVVTVAPGSELTVDVTLPWRNVTIRGRVTQGGQPVSGAWVYVQPYGSAAERSISGPYENVRTAADGTYVATLRADLAGQVIVSAFPPDPWPPVPTPTVAGTYYPAAATKDSAAPLTVQPGSVLTGIDMDLVPAATVEVRTFVRTPGEIRGTRAFVSLVTADTDLATPLDTVTSTEGGDATFTVRPGTVYVQVFPQGPDTYGGLDTNLVAGFFRAPDQVVASIADATPFTLVAGQNPTIDVYGPPGGVISGKVSLPDGSAPAEYTGGDVTVSVSGRDVPLADVALDQHGTFTISGLRTGTYRVTSRPLHGYTVGAQYVSPAGSPDVWVSAGGTVSDLDIVNPARFFDVQPTYAFAPYIEWLAAKGISTGYAQPDGSWQFKPTTAVSREAMAAFLSRDIAAPGFVAPSTSPFTDVPASYPFYPFISWLSANGISTGYADGTFRPTDPVSREAMAAFLYRAAGSPAYTPPATPRFSDVPVDHPFYAPISWLAEQGISTGYADGTFHPSEAVSRAAMAAFLERADPIFHPAP